MRSEVLVCLSFYLWLIIPAGGAYGLGSDHRRRSEIVLVKYEVKCLSVCLCIYLWLIIPAEGAYGLGSDHRRRSEIVLVKYERSGHQYTYMSGIYNIGLFVMAFQTGSSGQVLFFFFPHNDNGTCHYTLDKL